MINLFPEPKQVIDKNAMTRPFTRVVIPGADAGLLRIARLRFWNYPEIKISSDPAENAYILEEAKKLWGDLNHCEYGADGEI